MALDQAVSCGDTVLALTKMRSTDVEEVHPPLHCAVPYYAATNALMPLFHVTVSVTAAYSATPAGTADPCVLRPKQCCCLSPTCGTTASAGWQN